LQAVHARVARAVEDAAVDLRREDAGPAEAGEVAAVVAIPGGLDDRDLDLRVRMSDAQEALRLLRLPARQRTSPRSEDDFHGRSPMRSSWRKRRYSRSSAASELVARAPSFMWSSATSRRRRESSWASWRSFLSLLAPATESSTSSRTRSKRSRIAAIAGEKEA